MECITVSAGALQEDIARIFTALGVSESDAEVMARVLIFTEQCGIKSHGILRIGRYVDCLLSGGINARAPFLVEKCAGAWALANASGGLGIPASVKAMDLAMELAAKNVVGMVNVRKSHHNGAEGYYACMCAKRGMIGLAMSTGNPIMAATGACERVIGNNPFAYGVPAGKYGEVVMDVAMSAVADGKVQQAKLLGQLLPPGCFLDAEGRPSTDPDAYLNGGVLLPFGAHKGYGLAVMVECLAGVLSRAALTQEIDSWNSVEGKCGNTGHLFLAIDIAQIMPPAEFASRVEEMIGQFKAAKRLPGVKEIYFPGEIEKRRIDQAGGKVEIYASTAEILKASARSAGVVCNCL